MLICASYICKRDLLFTYTRTCCDVHGSRNHSAEAPLLLATPDNITVSAGTRLSLVCVAWGNPAPNITWTPDATAVPYQNVYNTSTTLNGLTYVVSILEVCYTEPQFSGTYSCTATNGVEDASLGGNSASFQVQGEVIPCVLPHGLRCCMLHATS